MKILKNQTARWKYNPTWSLCLNILKLAKQDLCTSSPFRTLLLCARVLAEAMSLLVMSFGMLQDVMSFTVSRWHLLQCVTDIMHQHFTLRQFALLSVPPANDDFEKHLLLTDTSRADNTYCTDLQVVSINDDSLRNIYISRPDVRPMKAEFSTYYKFDPNIIITWPEKGGVLPNLLHQIEDINTRSSLEPSNSVPCSNDVPS